MPKQTEDRAEGNNSIKAQRSQSTESFIVPKCGSQVHTSSDRKGVGCHIRFSLYYGGEDCGSPEKSTAAQVGAEVDLRLISIRQELKTDPCKLKAVSDISSPCHRLAISVEWRRTDPSASLKELDLEIRP